MPWTNELHLILPIELNDLVSQVKNLGITRQHIAVERDVSELINRVPKELEMQPQKHSQIFFHGCYMIIAKVI